MLARLPQIDALLAEPESRSSQQPEYCRNTTRSIVPDFLSRSRFVPTRAVCRLSAQTLRQAIQDRNGLGGYCPRHGSRFDLAGRVFKCVPAPLNLEIPPHCYRSEPLRVGDDGMASPGA